MTSNNKTYLFLNTDIKHYHTGMHETFIGDDFFYITFISAVQTDEIFNITNNYSKFLLTPKFKDFKDYCCYRKTEELESEEKYLKFIDKEKERVENYFNPIIAKDFNNCFKFLNKIDEDFFKLIKDAEKIIILKNSEIKNITYLFSEVENEIFKGKIFELGSKFSKNTELEFFPLCWDYIYQTDLLKKATIFLEHNFEKCFTKYDFFKHFEVKDTIRQNIVRINYFKDYQKYYDRYTQELIAAEDMRKKAEVLECLSEELEYCAKNIESTVRNLRMVANDISAPFKKLKEFEKVMKRTIK